MFLKERNDIVAKFAVYYKDRIPKRLEQFRAQDQNTSLVKEGLRELCRGFECPRLVFTIKHEHVVTNNKRLLAFERLLQNLLDEGSIEHFVRV